MPRPLEGVVARRHPHRNRDDYDGIDRIARSEVGHRHGVRRRLEPPIGPAPDAACGARPMHQAAKRAGAAPPVAAVGTMMPEDLPDPASERDALRRLLDGYAAPGRVRRLYDHQQPRHGWLRRLRRRRWWQRFLPASRRR
jgi:hypothetical protein